jgi:multiple sugar transport system substrate-binding protein
MNSVTTAGRVLGAILGTALLTSPALAQKTELTYAGWLNLYGPYVPVVEQLEADFENRFPELDWVPNDVPFDQALKQATVATLGGNAADNIHLIAGWVPALHEIGGLEPLNDYFSEEEWAKIPAPLLETVTFDGKIVAMPWVPGPIIMFYNRNLMEAAGLDPDQPPQTWPELMEQAKAICALPDVDGAPIYGVALRTQRNPNSAQWAIPIIFGHGGDLLDDNGEVAIDTEATRAAFAWVQELVESGCAPAGFSIDETRNTMAAGRAGFIFEGPWGRGLFANLSGGEMTTAPDGDVWVAPMPKDPDGNRRTIGNTHQITISAGSEHKDEAAEFVRYVVFDPAFTDAYFEASQQLSTSSMDLLTSGKMGADAYTQVFVEVLDHTYDMPIKSPKFYAIMDEIVPALQSVIQGGEIEGELANADRKIQRLMSR